MEPCSRGSHVAVRVFAVVADTLRAAGATDDADRVAARVANRLVAAFSVRQTETPANAAFQDDLQACLTALVALPEITDLAAEERAGVMAASLIGELEDRWDFTLRADWLRERAQS